MRTHTLQPPTIPHDFWHHPDVTAALHGRNFHDLFHLIKTRTGATQTQLAYACGITQSTISAIMTGNAPNQPARLDIIERIATGLRMPDHARTALGISPATPSGAPAPTPAPPPRPQPHPAPGPQPDPVPAALAETFGHALGRLLDETQTPNVDLARRVHIDPSYVTKLIRGQRTPNPELAQAIDQALNANGQLTTAAQARRTPRRRPPLPPRAVPISRAVDTSDRIADPSEHIARMPLTGQPTSLESDSQTEQTRSMMRRSVLSALAAFGTAAAAPFPAQLLQPPADSDIVGWRDSPRSLLWVTAQISARLSSQADITLGSSTMDHLRDDLYQVASDYVRTSDLPNVLARAILLHDRLSSRIHPSPAPRDAADLYVMMGATCILLASISHDFGESDAAMVQAQSAQVFADLAGNQQLVGWALCTKAMIELWRQRPYDALRHAGHGSAIGVRGDVQLRLVGLQIRALAQLGRREEAIALIETLDDLPHELSETDHMADLAWLGEAFSFPETRQHYYSAVSHAYLGNHLAVERSVAALGHGVRPPTYDGVWPISWALSRSYLAMARLDHRHIDGGPDAAAEALSPVLALPAALRINQLTQVFVEIERRLNSSIYHGNPTAHALSEAVRDFRLVPTRAIASS
jgi:transcriptional regulator with XRE-family HTH domain